VGARATARGRSGRGGDAAQRHVKPVFVVYACDGKRTADVVALRADGDAMKAATPSVESARLRILNRRAESGQAICTAIDAPDLMLRSGHRSGQSIG